MYARAAAVVFVVFAAGCSSTAVQSDAPDIVATAVPSMPEPSSIESSQPTESPMPSFATPGERYLALLEPLNDALCGYDTVATSPAAGRLVLDSAIRNLADATRAFVEETQKVDWPDATQDAIDELALGLAEHEAALRIALESTDDADYLAKLNAAQLARMGAAPAALLVRTSLGLEGLRQTCTPP